MTYLLAPRLHFAGQFQADPSTVNNIPTHFDTSRFQSNYNLPGQGATNGLWNPTGTAAWRLFGCTVQQVVYEDGTICDDPKIDPVVGTPVSSADGRTEGKIVDLDPQQQMVSELWGFRVVLGGVSSGFAIAGDFEVAPFADIWRRNPVGMPTSNLGAFYQSVLQNLDWTNRISSRFLQELEQLWPGNKAERKLSIKFNVDGHDSDRSSPTFTFGRIVGSIGLHSADEPIHFLAGRSLSAPPGATTAMAPAYAMIHGDSLFVDLGNSLPTQSNGGPFPTTLGRLYVAAAPANATPVLLGEIDYQNPNWYQQTSGIAVLKLSADQLRLAQSAPLTLGPSTPGQPLLAEAANGAFLRADKFVFRLNPGDTRTTRFYATIFGARASGQQISLGRNPIVMQSKVAQENLTAATNVGTPESALQSAKSITTAADGTAELQLSATDPGKPRIYIDGQVYNVTYQLGPEPPTGPVHNPSQFLSALVFSGYEIPDEPSWIEHVHPIFQQYADLYPVMRPIVDLADYGSVMARRGVLKNVFSAQLSDPNYMPVTRDLSEAKRTMIRKWLDNPVYMKLDSQDNLMRALQLAIELEHSTIPPYLCALYSIKPGANIEVSSLIRSIAVEEMLHMALVANIFVSLGGSPNIGHSKFVPQYPGPLPGGLRAGLTVRLRRCSIDQIRDCFMSIEEPEETTQIRQRELQIQDPTIRHPYTIGWFYSEITAALKELSASGQIQFGHADRQVTEWPGRGPLSPIGSLEDAEAAIQEIMNQGEGRSPSAPGDGDRELDHYYKFAEIVAGGHLARVGNVFQYTGAPIPFDPAEVWPMLDDPNMVLYPAGSRAQILATQFAESYQSLLKALNRTFNGDPGYLNQAIGLMYSLNLQAKQLVRTPSGLNDGTTAGPAFQIPM